MKRIVLDRNILGGNYTIGDLFVDDNFICNTLEDKVRAPDVKIQNKTAIPEGTYQVVIDFSNRFQRMMPRICDVPNFTGIRIHPGNTDKDTNGCILLGKKTEQPTDWLSNSRSYFDKFFELIRTDPDLTITITNSFNT